MRQPKNAKKAKAESAPEPLSTREKILLAARAELETTPPYAVGMRDIAARVGITAGAIYRHFPSKNAILEEIALEAIAAFDAAIAAGAREHLSPRKRWLGGWQGARSWALTNPQLFELFYNPPAELSSERISDAFARPALTLGDLAPNSDVLELSHPDSLALATSIWRIRSRYGSEFPDLRETSGAKILGIVRALIELCGTIHAELAGFMELTFVDHEAYLKVVGGRWADILRL